MEYIEIRVFDRDEQCAITEHVQRTGSVGDFIKHPFGVEYISALTPRLHVGLFIFNRFRIRRRADIIYLAMSIGSGLNVLAP
jgi:cytochrome bd-type quinol oxidase subunit 1